MSRLSRRCRRCAAGRARCRAGAADAGGDADAKLLVVIVLVIGGRGLNGAGQHGGGDSGGDEAGNDRLNMMISLLRCERRSIRLLTISRCSKEKGSMIFWILKAQKRPV
ncbi:MULTISPECIES: hypothetical protein [Mesorhizobium]|uniref:hypothetical protein n=1 Tax=Mesorhizobium sp. TaxID=1871066 RepID=UPI001F122625|nr:MULTISPECIES: hypothetical protein [Mesorhizobium]